MDPQISGTRKIRAKHSGMVVDVLGSGTDDGRPVVQNPDVGGDNQKFTFEDVGEGYYKIVNKHSNKVFDVENRGTGGGLLVQQWTSSDYDSQKWALEAG